ncbi:potassium channel subfamily K member 13 [Nerophis lumbriciformis]|uniref:potassium channel subfamily K member 13 n=1 Tax=Nerophis lumbriciformis TaxID=546530 RepID=UPI002ADF2A87|nr:potassium channel subfamily K member 13-like [Nerophis lumbriciformis]XP_061828052.1 potassium channel subfamily K member 13-like [Nerophis lumbriciformis]XP_061829269.1 potassium channel subfamily K member 13-like [Nerophis lumbriciformis]
MPLKKTDSWCGCPSPDTTRFALLGVLIALYMLAGAVLFSSLERSAEMLSHQLWEKRLRDFTGEHNISYQDLNSLLRHYEEARTAGIRAERGRALWDIPGAFYFVGTVVSTIGFGMTAPSTTAGKVLLVFYGLFGCSAAVLFFNLFLERVVTLLSLLLNRCHSNTFQHDRLEARVGGVGPKKDEWKPSTYQVTLILFAAVMAVACSAASLYSAMEGWTYSESLYFCFVAFSTVGFGDFVSGQRKQHEEIRAYQVANCVLMLLGVCCTYSLFNTISTMVGQGLDCMMATLARMCGPFCLCKLRRSCLSDCGSPTCCPRVPHACDECHCDGAKVETM